MGISDYAWSCLGVPLRGDADWIYYRLDCIGRIVWIVSPVSYCLDRIGWIVSVLVLGLLGETGFYVLAGLLLAIWDGWNGWGVSGTRVGCRDRR